MMSSSSEMDRQVTEQDDINAEACHSHSRRRDSFKPVAIPPPLEDNGSISGATKRFSELLRKSLTRGRRQTSLTPKEAQVLNSLSGSLMATEDAPKEEDNDDETKDTTTAPDDDDATRTTKARHRLSKSIVAHSKMLTRQETDFLEGLTDSSSVGAKDLEQCAQVLDNDPLYQNAVKPETKKDKRRPSLQPDASYRRELWTLLEAASEQSLRFSSPPSRNTKVTQKDGSKDTEKEENIETSAKQERNKWQSFVYKFQTMLKTMEELEETDQDEEDFVDDNGELPTFCVLASSIQQDLIDSPTVLTPPIMDALRPYLPYAVQQDNFWLKYSMIRDGASMHALLHNIRNSARTILAIETDQGDVFGAFTSSPWRTERGFYGSCEAFVWRLRKSRFTPCESVEHQIQLESNVEVFEWSRSNRNIQAWTGMDGELVVGGGGYDDGDDTMQQTNDKDFGSSLTITGELQRGFSDRCITFNSPPLTTSKTGDGEYWIANIEVWTLTPVTNLDEAERLELSRQFIFDHGCYLQQ